MQIHHIKPLFWVVLFYISFCLPVRSQDNVVTYKLSNGLTVCLNEDHTNQTVTAALVCRIADNVMPKGKEALAHCIEHMLFKGTDDLGTRNWEKEKPFYEAIITQYKKLDKARDEATRKLIKQKIQELSDSSAGYINHGEYYMLQENIGTGQGFTYNNDYTVYYNSFLPDKLNKWLDLNGHRFIHPVFREFLKEQKVVSQEYFERSKDNSTPRWDYIFNVIYGRPTNEQLTGDVYNLSLTDVINFYKKYYVPSNMALVISGNFSIDAAKSSIERSFSKIPAGKFSAHALPATPNFRKHEIFNAYHDDQRSVTLLFKGAPHLSKDYYSYRVIMSMLANGFNGLEDSIRHDRMIQSCHASWNWGKNECLYYIYANPLEHQTLKSVKQLVLSQVEKIANGGFSDEFLASAKTNIDREIDLEKENLFLKVSNMAQHFVYGMEIPPAVYQKSLFQSVKREDVMRVARKYLLNSYVALYPFQEKKNIIMPKDTDMLRGNLSFQKYGKSAYASHFDSIPDFGMKLLPFGFADVFDTTMARGVKYYSAMNRLNHTFHLKLVYKPAKSAKDFLRTINLSQRFEYLSPEGTDTWKFRQDLAKFACTYDFDDLNNGTVILNIDGTDKYFDEVMQLFSHLLQNPSVNQKEISRIEKSTKRKIYPVGVDSVKSIYKQIFSSISEVSYYGSLSTNYALSSVAQNFDLKEKKLMNPAVPNTVYHYESNIPQIKLWLYSKPSSSKYKMQMLVLKKYVFRVLWDQIRVANGLAYILGTDAKVPERDSTSGFLFASVRTKDYQIPAATEILTGILKNLPVSQSIFDCARQEVKNEYMSRMLNPKDAFDFIKDSKSKGITEDPELAEMDELDRLSLPEIVQFYKDQFGRSNVRIEIYGNMKEIGRANFDRFKKDLELRASL